MKRTSFRSRSMTAAAVAAAAALFLSACGGGDGGNGGDGGGDAAGETVTLNLATMVQESTPHFPMITWFFDELESRSDGRIVVERTAPESVCKAPEIAECVRDGRADIGVTIPDYTPQLFPTLSVVSLPFAADNASAIMEALYKMNTENADAQALWDENGLHFIGAWPVGRLIIGTAEEVDNIDDISGMRMRAIGPYYQQAIEVAGANVIAMPAAETYEGIRSGVADGVAWSFDGPVDYKLMELLPYWTDPGTGHYTVFSMWMNADVWNGMPEDLQQIFTEVTEEYNSGKGIEHFNEGAAHQCDSLLTFEGTERFDRWDEAATAEWADLLGTTMNDQWVTQSTTDNLGNAQQYLDEYLALIDELSANPDIVDDPVIACVDRFLDENG